MADCMVGPVFCKAAVEKATRDGLAARSVNEPSGAPRGEPWRMEVSKGSREKTVKRN